MKFSIIVVALNPGAKLERTLKSIFRQTYADYEVILKDGGSSDDSMKPWKRGNDGSSDGSMKPWKRRNDGSSDGAMELWKQGNSGSPASSEKQDTAGRVRFFGEPDKGIYDAMNQAVSHAAGEFLIFLNCGDLFAGERVLEQTAQRIEKERQAGADMHSLVLYGDTWSEKNQVSIASPPAINGFVCYRNIPCHQVCFYSRKLCVEKPYDLNYRIRADYDHFLWCFYTAKAKIEYMGFSVASYEGGGFSENRENRKRDRLEHRQITEAYMGRRELFRYRAVMACTLAPLRTAMAESKLFSPVYHAFKGGLYHTLRRVFRGKR